MTRDELDETQLDRLLALLPPGKPHTGRPAKDLRRTLLAILWINRTGAAWRDLPDRYGAWQTAANRFYRWRRAGVWARVLDALMALADAEGTLDWTLHAVDSTTVRAHPHAAGGKGGPRRRPSAVRGVVSPPRSICGATDTAIPLLST